jgi:hypothetical protein
MATIDDAARLALELPQVRETTTFGHRAWAVAGTVFTWERPFRKADLRRFGDRPVPAGDILALASEDLSEKEATLAAHPGVCFTIEHFDGYPAVLVRLEAAGATDVLPELIEDAWLAKAPRAAAEDYLAWRGRGRS